MNQRVLNDLQRTWHPRGRMICLLRLLSRQKALPATNRKTEKERQLAHGGWGTGGWGWSQILQRRESLVLDMSFNTLCRERSADCVTTCFYLQCCTTNYYFFQELYYYVSISKLSFFCHTYSKLARL